MEYSTSMNINPETRHESLSQIPSDFLYSADICDLHLFPGNTFPWHWHQELEVFYMREGKLKYHLPNSVVAFEKGQGGFLNTNVLHKTTCQQEDLCIQEEQQFTPAFIGGYESSRIMRKYVQPILTAPDIALIKFDPDIPEHRPLLECLCHCYEVFEAKPDGYELEIQQEMTRFWQLLYHLTQSLHGKQNVHVDDHRIKQMLLFIAEHYAEHIQLEDIAAAAFMSPRACGRCFQSQLGTTPFAYLTDYRIQRACEMLVNTTLPIGEIALQCGFCSNSYFGRIFREKTGMTPNDYRKNKKRKTGGR